MCLFVCLFVCLHQSQQSFNNTGNQYYARISFLPYNFIACKVNACSRHLLGLLSVVVFFYVFTFYLILNICLVGTCKCL